MGYVDEVLARVAKQNPEQAEFKQAVEEVFRITSSSDRAWWRKVS